MMQIKICICWHCEYFTDAYTILSFFGQKSIIPYFHPLIYHFIFAISFFTPLTVEDWFWFFQMEKHLSQHNLLTNFFVHWCGVLLPVMPSFQVLRSPPMHYLFCLIESTAYFSAPHFKKNLKIFLLADISCTGRFHCDIFMYAYNVSWLDSPPPSFSLVPPPFLK
jgi:hypothetical protein